MTYDCVIRGGTIVTAEDGPNDADLAISDGRVAALLPRNSDVESHETVDAHGLLVLPGLVEPHAHVELGPGEDRYKETRSAVLGGITTVMTYLTSAHPYPELHDEELRLIQRDAVADVLIHLGLSSSRHLEHVDSYIDEWGLRSFKHYMHFKGAEGAYMGAEGTDDGHLVQLLRRLAKRPQVMLNVHAENVEVVWRLVEEQKAAGRNDLAAWTDTRPDFVEAEKIGGVTVMAATTGARVYFVHVSSAMSLEVHRRLRSMAPGQTFIETCPHYLTHTKYSGVGLIGKVNPPLRTQQDVDALWEAVADGTVDTIGTDHVARSIEHKDGDIWTASAGFPGMATVLPVLMSEGHHGRGLPVRRIVELTSRNPARLFGLYPRKGTLRPDSDADLVLVDPELERTVVGEDLLSHARYSIYDGWSLKGWPVRTFLRGSEVARGGEVVAEPGAGRLLNSDWERHS